MNHTGLLVALLLGLSACRPFSQDLPPPSPIPTPRVVTVSFTPATRPVTEALQNCGQSHPELALLVSEKAATRQHIEPGDINIRFGEPDDSYSFLAPLAQGRIVVIVHPQNPATELTLESLQALFSGEILNWPELGAIWADFDFPVQAWGYPSGEDVERLFSRTVLGVQSGSNSITSLAPDPVAMLEAVSAYPGSVGYLPLDWVNTSVQVMTLPPDLAQNLRQPVLAFANGQPVTSVENLIICLQSGAGQAILEQRYQSREIQ